MTSTVVEIKTHTSMRTVNAFMKTGQDIQYMKNIKKTKFDGGLVPDKTGRSTGKIRLKRISEKLGTDNVKTYFILFEKGAKSKIHLHDTDQIIFAFKGTGVLVTFSRIDTSDETHANLSVQKSVNLKEGDSVLIPSGTLHWHGASESSDSSQLSVMKNGNTFWF